MQQLKGIVLKQVQKQKDFFMNSVTLLKLKQMQSLDIHLMSLSLKKDNM